MNFYKTEKYVYEKLGLNSPAHAEHKVICVLDNYESAEYFTGLDSFITEINTITSIADVINDTTVKGKDEVVYKLATVIEEEPNGIHRAKFSSIVKYLCSDPYRFKNIYLSDKNEIVDFTERATRDIHERRICMQGDNYFKIVNNPNSLVEFLHLQLLEGYSINGDVNLSEIYNSMSYRLQRSSKDDKHFVELLEQGGTSLFRHASRYEPLLEWLLSHEIDIKMSLRKKDNRKNLGYSYEDLIGMIPVTPQQGPGNTTVIQDREIDIDPIGDDVENDAIANGTWESMENMRLRNQSLEGTPLAIAQQLRDNLVRRMNLSDFTVETSGND